MTIILEEKIRQIRQLEMIIHKCEMQYVSSIVAENDLYKGNMKMLMMVEQLEGLSQKEISEHIHVKPASTTVMLKRAEKAGLIKRVPDDKDLRTIRVYITDEGRLMAQKMKSLFNEVSYEIYNVLSKEDMDEYIRILQKIHDSISSKVKLDFNCNFHKI